MSVIFFYSHKHGAYTTDVWRHVFSQWYQRHFSYLKDSIYDLSDVLGENEKYLIGKQFNCREQFMMAMKALIFLNKNPNNINVYATIMSSTNPAKIKKLGRMVKGFDETVWQEWRYKVVVNGNHMQFSQDGGLKKILLDTGDSYLVEASPYDRIWGIGMDEKLASKVGRDVWEKKGLNLLGKALVEVRSFLNK